MGCGRKLKRNDRRDSRRRRRRKKVAKEVRQGKIPNREREKKKIERVDDMGERERERERD